MPDIREIEYWISRYEQEASTLDDCVKLDALQSIRDRMLGVQISQPQPQIAAYSETAAPTGETIYQYGDSEFLRAVAGKDPADVWAIMDEHMDTLRLVNPRAYAGVMRKLNGL